MLVGAGAASAGLLFTGGLTQHRYKVVVNVKHDATAEQKATIESTLHVLHPVDTVRFANRDQAWQEFQRDFKDSPDIVTSTSRDSMPESFQFTTRGREFDCDGALQIQHLPGVDQVVVVQLHGTGDSPHNLVRVECY
jgi:cell division protein FtsX